MVQFIYFTQNFFYIKLYDKIWLYFILTVSIETLLKLKLHVRNNNLVKVLKNHPDITNFY